MEYVFFFLMTDQTKLPEDDKTYSEPSDPIVTERTPLYPSISVGQYQATDPYQGYDPQVIPTHLLLSYHDTVAIMLIEHWCVE